MSVWINSHTNIRLSPKTMILARILDVNRVRAIGHLHCFWWSLKQNAPDRDLSHFDVEDLASMADWSGAADLFFGAMIASGYLKEDGGSLVASNWGEG